MKKFYSILAILFVALTIVPTQAFAVYSWTDQTNAPSADWSGIASSSDGTKMVAVVFGGDIYTSTDSGANWVDRSTAGTRNWRSVSMSSDGTKMVAVDSGGYIYTSTNSGSSWTERTASGQRSWVSVSMSSNGSKIVAAVYNGSIYTSADDGVVWTDQTNAGARNWYSVAISGDGTKIIAGVNGGAIWSASYVSPFDASPFDPVTWTNIFNGGSWVGLSVSSDGTKMVGIVNGGAIYTATSPSNSSDWFIQSSAGISRLWFSVSMSSDGTKIVAVTTNGDIYTSVDSGATWTDQTNLGAKNWYSTVISGDGTKIAAAVYGGHIYTSSMLTLSDPTVTTPNSSSITRTAATLGGTISATGGEGNTARGVNYGLTTGYGSTVSESGSYSTGAFTMSVTGLVCGTTYHYAVFSTNGAGTGTSSDSTFTTLSCPSSRGGSVPIAFYGGGGGTTVVPTIVVPVVVTPVVPVVATQTPAVQNNISTSKKLTKHLNKGMKDEETKILQAFLIDQNVGTSVNSLYISSYFGPRTKSALSQWQKENGLDSDGVLGPQTRAMINGLLK